MYFIFKLFSLQKQHLFGRSVVVGFKAVKIDTAGCRFAIIVQVVPVHSMTNKWLIF